MTFKVYKNQALRECGFKTAGFNGNVTINDNDSCFEDMPDILHKDTKVNSYLAKYQYQTKRLPAPEERLLSDFNKSKH